MPVRPMVGRRELERWSEAQQTSATPAAIERAIAQAQASGTLNLTSRGLVEVPEELCAWNAKGQSDKWWEVVQLAKLDLSHNELRHLPEELFEALDSLQTLHVGNNGLSELPSSLQRCKILARINLQHNAFQRLPSFIGALEGLVHVNLDHNALTRLPDALCDLVLVETLTCPFNQLAALPERLGRMRALTKLDASSNALAALPASIGDLASLSELEVGHNRLSALPEAMARLGALVRLDCRENALSGAGGIPASPRLAELLLGFNRLQMLPRGLPPSLSVLDVRDNLLVEVDEVELLPLVRLKTLDLRNNELSRLPPRLGLMTSLSALLLEGNPLKAVRRAIVTAPAREILEYLRSRIEEPSSSAQQPAGSQQHRNAPLGAPPSSRDSSSSHDTHDARGGCGGFGGQDVASAVRLSSTTGKLLLRSRNLRELPPDAGRVADVPLHTLDLADNLLESLAGCGRLGGVTHLDASNNQLAAAGDALGRDLAPLRALASLKMRHNFLPRFPRFVASLNALTELDLSQNRIADFPVGVCGALPRLHTLLVCYNRLESLAPDVDGLRSLTHLDASNNQLVSLPDSLLSLPCLASLSVENNALATLDPRLALLPALRALLVDGNPLKTIRRAVIAGGSDSLLAFLRNRLPEGAALPPPPAAPVAPVEAGIENRSANHGPGPDAGWRGGAGCQRGGGGEPRPAVGRNAPQQQHHHQQHHQQQHQSRGGW